MKVFWNKLDQREERRSSGIFSRMTEKGVWAQELWSGRSWMGTDFPKAAWNIPKMGSLWRIISILISPMPETMWWEWCRMMKWDATLSGMSMRLLEIAEHYFHSTEREYIETASDPGKAFFFTLWTFKGKLYENDRQGDEPSAWFFRDHSKRSRLCSGKITEKTRLFQDNGIWELYFLSVHGKRFFFAAQGLYRASVTLLPFAAIQHGLELIF